MNPTTTSNWYSANYTYLMTGIATIHEGLKHYIARKNNQPTQSENDTETALKTAAANLPAPSRLEQLCLTFGLSNFERDILLLCVGMELDPSFSSLIAEAQGNPLMAYPTFSLTLVALNSPHLKAIQPTSPLRHYQLIDVGQGIAITQSPLKIDESILYYLAGEDYEDGRLAHLIKPLPPEISTIPLVPSQQKIVTEITTKWLENNTEVGENTENQHYPIVQLCGKDKDSKEIIASTICTTLKFPPQILSLRHLPLESDSLNLLIVRWQRQAILTKSALLIQAEQIDSNDTLLLNAITELIENSHTPLIITTRENINFPKRPSITFDIPYLTRLEQQIIWKLSLEEIAEEMSGDIEQLVNHFNLSSKAIINACSQVKRNIKIINNPSAATSIAQQLWYIGGTSSRPQLKELAERLEPFATWEDLILPAQEKNKLSNIISQVRQLIKVYEKWGFAKKTRRGLGISALFYGASGTGKTMAAEVIANELKLEIYRIELSNVTSKYIGETEKNLRQIFEAAEGASVILLFDEADALFGKRTEVKDSRDRYANMTVSYLLQQMETYKGLSILTTNMKDALDRAFMRRLRFTINFTVPEKEARIQIWQNMFPPETPTQELNYRKLAQLCVGGGNIRNIALNAAFMAADNNESVMMKHLLDAARIECVKIEKLISDPEIKGWV